MNQEYEGKLLEDALCQQGMVYWSPGLDGKPLLREVCRILSQHLKCQFDIFQLSAAVAASARGLLIDMISYTDCESWHLK